MISAIIKREAHRERAGCWWGGEGVKAARARCRMDHEISKESCIGWEGRFVTSNKFSLNGGSFSTCYTVIRCHSIYSSSAVCHGNTRYNISYSLLSLYAARTYLLLFGNFRLLVVQYTITNLPLLTVKWWVFSYSACAKYLC